MCFLVISSPFPGQNCNKPYNSLCFLKILGLLEGPDRNKPCNSWRFLMISSPFPGPNRNKPYNSLCFLMILSLWEFSPGSSGSSGSTGSSGSSGNGGATAAPNPPSTRARGQDDGSLQTPSNKHILIRLWAHQCDGACMCKQTVPNPIYLLRAQVAQYINNL